MPEVAGAEYWYVIYKAIGDFGDLIRDAAKARAEMEALSKAAKAEGDAEVLSANKAAEAHKKDSEALERRTKAYSSMAAAAKAANVQTLFGGRSDMGQHLSDMAAETNWQNLLLRARNLGFTSPQAAYSWKQLELQQAYLMNRARFGATSAGTGFTTPNEYLAYLAREYTASTLENQALLVRAQLYRRNADAALAYTAALSGHAQTFGTIGTSSSASLAGMQSFQAALAGMPDQVTTKLQIDDTEAMARLARDRDALMGIPRIITTREVLTAGAAMGAVPVRSAAVDVSLSGPYERQLNDLADELISLSQARVNIPVSFALPSAASISSFIARLPTAGAVQRVNLAPGGGAVGVGAGPPGGGGGGGGGVGVVGPAPPGGGGGGGGGPGGGINALGQAADNVRPKLDALTLSTTRFYGWIGQLNKHLTLFAGIFGSAAVIGSIALWHVLLDGIAEAAVILITSLATLTIGLVAWGAAAYQSGVKVYNQMKNVLTVSEALQVAVAPLKGTFEGLVDAVRPQVFEAFGVALDAINGKSGVLQKVALETGQVIDRWMARLQVDLAQGQGGLKTFLDAGASFLRQFTEIFANFGHAMANIIRAGQLTHIAEILVGVVVVLSKLLDIITKIPAPALAAILALHGFILWGGLATTLLGKIVVYLTQMVAAIGPLNGAMFTLAERFGATDKQLVNMAKSSPAVKGMAEALGMTTAQAATFATQVKRSGQSTEELARGTAKGEALFQTYAARLDKAGQSAVTLAIAAGGTEAQVAKLAASAATAGANAGFFARALASVGGLAGLATAGLAVLAVAVAAFAYLALTAKDNTKKWIDTLNDGLVKTNMMGVVGKTVSDLAAVTQQLTHTQGLNAQAVHELQGQHDGLNEKLGMELSRVGQVSKLYGTDFKGALQLLNTAGVRTSDLFSKQNLVWATALEQVHGLVEGYKAMGQQSGMIGRDLDALLLSESEQVKAMDNLNKAWDSFTKLVSGPTDNIIKLGEGFNQFNKDAKTAGAAMLGLNSPSLTLQKDFQSNYATTQQLFDAFRSTQAAGASGNFEKFVKLAVQSLIPLAGHNKAAAAEISALAQEAGGPASTNLQVLSKWAGHTADPLHELYKQSMNASVGVSDLSADAAKLTDTLQNDLNPAMATAIFNANGGQKVFQVFADAVVKHGVASSQAATAAGPLVKELLAVSGNSANAKAHFVGMATAMGASKDEAEKLWASGVKLSGTKYKLQLEDNIHAEQEKLKNLHSQLNETTDPKKRRQIKLEIKVEEDKLKNLKDKLHDAAQSAGDVRKGLAGAAGASDDLSKSGFFAQAGDKFRTNVREMGDWFTRVLPHAIGVAAGAVGNFFTKTIPSAAGSVAGFFTGPVAGAWSSAYEGFQRDFAGPLTNWFTVTLPGALGAAWDAAWSALVSPVVHAFDTIKTFISSSFDKWWTTHGDAIKAIWKGVTDFFIGTWNDAWGLIMGVGHVFRVWWDNFTGGLKLAWNTLIGWFTSGGGDIGKAIKGTLGTILAPFKLIAGAIILGFKIAWDFVFGVLRTIAAFAVAVWHIIGDALILVFKIAWGIIVAGFKIIWDTIVAAAKIAWDIIIGIINVVIDILTGHWNRAWHDIEDMAIQVWNAIKEWGIQVWNALKNFAIGVWNALVNFIKQAWHQIENFAKAAWQNIWGWFHRDIVTPMATLFTKTIPGWFNSFVNFAKTAWKDAASWFHTNLITPIANFFTKTLPNTIESAFKNSVNWVVDHVVNGFLHIINKVTGIVGIPKIPDVGHVAAAGGLMPGGGSVPGTGDEDGTHIVAMGGEYMLRKPARMALESAYGRGYMDYLNQADQWLGSGSRGNLASQRRAAGGPVGMASGGLHNPIGPGARPARVDMGVDYLGSFPLYALGSGRITNVYNSGWPGEHAFIDLQLNPPYGTGYWFYAEDIVPSVRVGQSVTGGQEVGNATGSGRAPGIEVGWASGVGGQTAAARDHQIPASGDPGAHPTAWGVAASQLIKSLGGPPGIISGSIIGGKAGIGNFIPIWQSVLGLLDATGNALSGKMGPLVGYIKGGASQLLKLAKIGGKAVFDGVWSAAIQPLINAVLPSGGSVSGDVLRLVASNIKGGVDKLMSDKDTAAQKSAAASGVPGTAVSGNVNSWITQALKLTGMPESWRPGLQTLIQAESAGDPHAHNASGASGLAQMKPGTFAANEIPGHPDIWNPVDNLAAAIVYITKQYHTPSGIPNLGTSAYKGYAAGGEVDDEMAAGGPFKTQAELRARLANRQYGERADYYGLTHAFATGPAKYRTKLTMQELGTLSRRQATEIAAFNKVMGALSKANLSHFGATARGVETVARDQALNRVPGGHPGYAAGLRGYLHDISALSGQAIPVATGPSGVGNIPGLVPEWMGSVNSLQTAVISAESPAFWKLMGSKLPAHASRAQHSDLAAWDRALTHQQYKTFGLGHSPPGAFAVLRNNFGTPSKITAAQWDAFSRDVNYMVREEAGPGIHGGFNPPGTPRNSGWVPWHYLHARWLALRNQLLKVQSRIPLARKVWQNVYGPGHLSYTPRPDITPPRPGVAPLGYNIASLITGGPATPVFGSLNPDMGFSGGGTIDTGGLAAAMAFGGPVGLEQVSGMFSGIMPSSMLVPVFPPGGISDATLRKLSGSRASREDAPRRLSAAGARHSAAFNVEQLTINNPVAEQPSQSIARSANRLAFYAGRGLG